MPILDNPRHEAFAQALAAGTSAHEAYERAGYRPNEGNCIRLKGNERIQARVRELQKPAADAAEITVASLTRMFLEDRELAHSLGQAAAAVAACDRLAKLHGYMIDRKEIRTGALDDLPADTLTEVRGQLIAARDRRADRGVQSGHSGKPH